MTEIECQNKGEIRMNAPRLDALVNTPAGPGRVHRLDVPYQGPAENPDIKGLQVRQWADNTVMVWRYEQVTCVAETTIDSFTLPAHGDDHELDEDEGVDHEPSEQTEVEPEVTRFVLRIDTGAYYNNPELAPPPPSGTEVEYMLEDVLEKKFLAVFNVEVEEVLA